MMSEQWTFAGLAAVALAMLTTAAMFLIALKIVTGGDEVDTTVLIAVIGFFSTTMTGFAAVFGFLFGRKSR